MHEVEVEEKADKKKDIPKKDESDDDLLEMMENNEDEDYLAGILDEEWTVSEKGAKIK